MLRAYIVEYPYDAARPAGDCVIACGCPTATENVDNAGNARRDEAGVGIGAVKVSPAP